MSKETDKNKHIKDSSAPKEPDTIEKFKQKYPDIENKDLQKVVSFSVAIAKKESYHSGPLPAPETLQGYQTVDKTFPERIVKSFEKQVNHRLKIEEIMVNSKTSNEKRGQIFAFIISLIVIISGIILIMFDKDWLGFSAIIADLVGLAIVFIGGKQYSLKQKELEIRERELASKNQD